MTISVTQVYDDRGRAREAVAALEAAGFAPDKISIVARHDETEPVEDTASGLMTGAALGGVAGAGAGLLTALGVIAVPGLGPLVAAGALATTLTGAASGAVAGGLLGALLDYGLTDEEAHVYAESIRRGGTLVSVRAPDDRADEARAILRRFDPVDPAQRRRSYVDEGWSGYDPKAPPYTRDQIARERDRYGL